MGQWSVVSDQWSVISDQWLGVRESKAALSETDTTRDYARDPSLRLKGGSGRDDPIGMAPFERNQPRR